jgi:predicted nuclease of predicted toxin-antitoxin system
MRFLLDENVPKAAAGVLEQKGHEVFDFRGTSDEGMEDPSVFAKAQELDAVLLTTDRDFFHTIPHLFETHAGVVVIALRQPNRSAILSRLNWLLDRMDQISFAGRCFQLRDSTWIAFPPLP